MKKELHLRSEEMKMARTLVEVEKELDTLSPEDRELLLQRFFDRQAQMEPSIKEAWVKEADKRLDEMLSGEVEGIDAEDVFTEMQRIIDEKD
jgi:predicted metalloprotease with PDZ domain